jgi:hypothetical protein
MYQDETVITAEDRTDVSERNCNNCRRYGLMYHNETVITAEDTD